MANKLVNTLEVEKLSKVFKNGRGIKEINFDLPVGSFAVLMGENGAGKTTLIRCITRIYQEFVGEIRINDIPNESESVYKNISYVGENVAFPTEFTMRAYLEWAGVMRGLSRSKTSALINSLASDLVMTKHLSRNPNRFSSGEKQKVMLIKTLIEDSDFIIMDEPTANLDPGARLLFFNQIKKMNLRGKTVLICSHNLEELEDKVSHVLVMRDGRFAYFNKKTSESLLTIYRRIHESDKKKEPSEK